MRLWVELSESSCLSSKEMIRLRLNLVLILPNKSEKQDPKGSTCFQVMELHPKTMLYTNYSTTKIPATQQFTKSGIQRSPGMQKIRNIWHLMKRKRKPINQNWSRTDPDCLNYQTKALKSFLLVFHRIKKLSRDMTETKRPKLNFWR